MFDSYVSNSYGFAQVFSESSELFLNRKRGGPRTANRAWADGQVEDDVDPTAGRLVLFRSRETWHRRPWGASDAVEHEAGFGL